MQRREFLVSNAALVLTGALVRESAGQEPPVRKVAFLAGVSKYDKDGFENLSYCERDVAELADELRKHGFQVTTLTGAAATKEALDAQLKAVFATLDGLKKEDVALLAFSGHGVQSLVRNPDPKLPDVEDAFFCPVNASKSRTDTMISISWVMRQLDEHSGSSQNLVLVDACRNNPNKGGKTIDGSTVKELPNKISVLFSSSAGKESYESDQVKHGVFTHVLLQGLRGEAANRQGQITWLSLASYAMDEVPRESMKVLADPNKEQRPNLLGNLVRQPVLARVDLPPRPAPPVPGTAPKLLVAPFGESEAKSAQRAWATHLKVDPEFTNKLGMRFALIPPGEFQMGSPAGEAERGNGEVQHRVRITQAYYLGLYEVTQKEWEDVMGSQPSWFSRNGGGKDKVAGLDTSRFPVEQVSWEDAVEYCRKLSQRDGLSYRLPTEAEWEYGCRAGTTSAFHFGDVLNGDKANVLEGKYLYRTARVGSYASNAFGLYDLHGNVWEWCADWWSAPYDLQQVDNPVGPKEGSDRVRRGGSWCGTPRDCRSAYRRRYVPSGRYFILGFRLALVAGR